MRIAFFGLPLGACLLAGDGHAVALAVLSPVDAPGRRRVKRRLPRVIDARTPGFESEVERALAETRPDLLVSWFWTRRLPEKWLGLARLGGIGAHPSLLPRHRGPDPYFWAIDSGDDETGVSIHRLTAEYDDGPVLARSVLQTGNRDSWQLARALDRPSLRLLRDVTARLRGGETVSAEGQDPSRATWAGPPEGELLHVDWGWPTERVLRRIRALSPTPGVALDVLGKLLTVKAARRAEAFPLALAPGEGAFTGEPAVFLVRTGDGAVILERASPSDEDEIDARSPAAVARLVLAR